MSSVAPIAEGVTPGRHPPTASIGCPSGGPIVNAVVPASAGPGGLGVTFTTN